MSDLIESAADEALLRKAPLAARLRPRKLDDLVGQEKLLGPGAPLRTLIEADRLTSIILWGPPGCGKTTLARVIANHTEKEFETLSAVSATVKDVRSIIDKLVVASGKEMSEPYYFWTKCIDSTRRSKMLFCRRWRMDC